MVGLLETDSAVQVTDINIDSVKDSDITQKAKFLMIAGVQIQASLALMAVPTKMG